MLVENNRQRKSLSYCPIYIGQCEVLTLATAKSEFCIVANA